MDRLALRLASLALLLAVPLMLSTHIEDVFFGAWRAAEWAFLAPVLLWSGTRWILGRGVPRLAATTWPWAALAGWAMLGSTWSVNPADGWRRALELTGSIAAVWLGLALASQPRRLLAGAVVAAVVCSAYGVLQFFGIDPLPWSTKFGERAFGTLGNPDYYAGHLLLIFPLLSLFSTPYFFLPASAILVTGFLFSQVRGAWLVAGGLMAWTALWIVPARTALTPARRALLRRFAAAAAILLAVVAAASPDFRERFASVVSVGGYDATGRRFLWTVAARIWRERPVQGFGTGSFKYEFPRKQIIGLEFPQAQFHSYNYSEHAHFELLQLGAELGLIGVVLFLAGLLVWLARWIRGLRSLATEGAHEEWWLQLMLGTTLAGGLGYSVVNFPFQIVPTALLWWTVLGISLGRLERGLPSPSRQGVEVGGAARSGQAVPGPFAIAAAAVVILVGAAGAVTTAADLVGSGYLHEVHGNIELKNYRAAKGWFELGMRMTPYDYRLPKWVARIAAVEGDTVLAERMLAIRQRVHPRLADALDDRAQAYRQAGQRDAALGYFLDLVRIAPNYVSAWSSYLGPIYFERKEYDKAADAFRQGVKYQDNNAPAWHNLASALGTMKRYQEALEADEAAIQRDPAFPEAYIGAALSAKMLGQRDRAVAIAQRGATIAPNDPRFARLIQQISR